MKFVHKIFVIICIMVLPACSRTILLGMVHSPPGTTEERRDIDTINCKEEAEIAVNSPVNQTADFLLGASLIGLPFASAKNESIQRDTFARCMSSRGYRVDTPDGKSALPSNSYVAPSGFALPATNTSTPSSSFPYSMTLPAGWKVQPVPDVLSQRGVSYHALNRTKDAGLAMGSIHRDDVGNLTEYAKSIQAGQLSLLTNSDGSDIQALQLDGREARRYTVNGIFGGIKVIYLTTIIAGDSSVISLNTWTSNRNFSRIDDDLEGLANLIVWPDGDK